MTMRDKLAAVLWRTEAVNTGTPQSVIDGRTPEAFAGESLETRRKWLKYADAILATLPDMVPGLVWKELSIDFYRSECANRGRYEVYGFNEDWWCMLMVNGVAIRIKTGVDSPASAKAAAEAHHREAVAKMAGWV